MNLTTAEDVLWLLAMQQANAFLYEECGMSAAVMLKLDDLWRFLTECRERPEAQETCLQYRLARLLIESLQTGTPRTWRQTKDDRFPYEFTAERGLLRVKNYREPHDPIPRSQDRYAAHVFSLPDLRRLN